MSAIHQGAVAERVKKCLREQAEVYGPSVPEFQNDASLADFLGYDSLDLIEATMSIEDEFGIEIDDEQMTALTTVQEVIDLVTEKVRP